jgi:VanZ family protein
MPATVENYKNIVIFRKPFLGHRSKVPMITFPDYKLGPRWGISYCCAACRSESGTHRRVCCKSVYRLLLLVLLLIIYGSLYPWNFHLRSLDANPLWLVITSWPTRIDRFVVRDLAVNIVLYIPLGLCGFLVARERYSRAFRVVAVLVLALALSYGIEVLQLFDLGRFSSALDVLANVTGAAIGAMLASRLQPSIAHSLEHRDLASLFHFSAPTLLLGCWLGYELFPFFPTLGHTQLLRKLAVLLFHLKLSPLDAFASLAAWLVVARLLEEVIAREWVPRALAFALFVLPAKLFISGRTITWAELMGAALAYAFWYIFLRENTQRTLITAGVLGAYLLLYGLWPLHFSHVPAQFSWAPFRDSLQSDWTAGLPILLKKAYWYGALIWLFRITGIPHGIAATGVALLLALMEGIQVYLPAHSAEITDPLLAILMAVALSLADRTAPAYESRRPARTSYDI